MSSIEFPFYNLPIGPQGPTGATGTIGPTGPQGNQGSPGPQGPQGQLGFQGFQGSQGNAGTPGQQGPQGSTGNQGPQGIQGQDGNIVGPQGPQGVQGPQGIQGAGFQGPQGNTGVQGPQGFVGGIGPQGPAGPSTGIAGGDLFGNYPNPTVVQIQGNPVDKLDGSGGAVMYSTGSKWTSLIPSGDVQGNSPANWRVGRLNGTLIQNVPPVNNQPLVYSSALLNYQPQPIVNSIQAGTGITVSASTGQGIVITATNAAPSGPAGGDLGNTYPNPSVLGMIGYPLDWTTIPLGSGSFPVFNGTKWQMAAVTSAPFQVPVWWGDATHPWSYYPQDIVNSAQAGPGIELSANTGTVEISTVVGSESVAVPIAASVSVGTGYTILQGVGPLNGTWIFFVTITIYGAAAYVQAFVSDTNSGAGTPTLTGNQIAGEEYTSAAQSVCTATAIVAGLVNKNIYIGVHASAPVNVGGAAGGAFFAISGLMGIQLA
jgi:hypothetical protein